MSKGEFPEILGKFLQLTPVFIQDPWIEPGEGFVGSSMHMD
jgi:hypothetical protein